ncbi:MAG: hypothetical protein HUJ72_01055, partial [Blautia sp.]|nr:hypothetical protein [Blautia sp.]
MMNRIKHNRKAAFLLSLLLGIESLAGALPVFAESEQTQEQSLADEDPDLEDDPEDEEPEQDNIEEQNDPKQEEVQEVPR